MDEDEKGELVEKPRLIPGGRGGTLHPWPKGVSGNPAGSLPGSRSHVANQVKKAWLETSEDNELAQAVLEEYMRLCLHARSEDLRAKMLMDLLDRAGVPRQTEGSHGASAVAQVVNIIRNSPELGV